MFPCATRCVVAAVRRARGGGGEREQHRGGRFSTAWRLMARRTCRRWRRCLSAPSEVQPKIRKMRTLEMQPLMCRLTWLVLISTIYLSILSILSSISISWSSTSSPTRRCSWRGQVALATTQLHINSSFPLRLVRLPNGTLCVERSACVRVRRWRWRSCRISGCFSGLCGYLHGAAGSTTEQNTQF